MKSSPFRAALLGSASPRVRFWALAVLLSAIFLMGGGSRSDIMSLVVLRPLAALFAVFAILQISREEMRSMRMPLIFLGLLALLIAVQLIPLPPSMWQSLPGREIYSDAYVAARMDAPWQPLAISPSRALNSFFSLVVPLAILLNWAIQDTSQRPAVFTVIWLAAVASAFLGILQLLGPANGPLYLYRVSTEGMPVGLFANRNHQALMIAIGIALAGYHAARALKPARIQLPLLSAAAGSVLIFAPLLLVTGSRAGLVLGAAMIVAAALLARREWRQPRSRRTAKNPKVVWVGAAVAAGALAAVIAAAIWFSRSLALERLMGKSIEIDLRVEVMPVVLGITKGQFPFGAGFGSFEFIYRQFEPARLLMPAYLNHAHNDWVEFVLEGGLPGALLLAMFVGWIAQAAFRQWWTNDRRLTPEATVSILVAIAVGLLSVVDYPLRTPSIAAVFAVACAFLAQRQVRH